MAERISSGAALTDLLVPPGSVNAYLLALLGLATAKPLVVVTSGQAEADRLADELDLFLAGATPGSLGPVARFPTIDWTPYEGLSPDRVTVMARLTTLFRLAQGGPTGAPSAIVLPAETLLKRVVPPVVLAERSDLVISGEDLDRDDFTRRLSQAGYNRVPLVEEPGTFAVRGSVIDVHCPLHSHPARVEQWGDTVDSIRFFDPANQRTLEEAPELIVAPVREEPRDPASLARARERLVARADEDQVPSSRLRALLTDLAAGHSFFGIEGLLPAFHERLATVVDYLPKGAVVVVLDEEGCAASLSGAAEAARAAFERRTAGDEVRFRPEEHYLAPEDALESLRQVGPIVMMGGVVTGEGEPLRFGAATHEGLAAEVRAEPGREPSLAPLARRVHDWLADGHRVALVVPSRGRAERIRMLLKAEGFRIVVGGEGIDLEGPARDGLTPGALEIRIGRPHSGFTVAAHRLVVVAAGQVLGRLVRRRPERTLGRDVFQATLSDLREGDLLVHGQHGIGRYGGMMRLPVDGLDQDFLLLNYEGEDRLYLPVYRLDLIQRYAGGETGKARLDKLGGAAWERARSKARASVRRLAMDLLKLHANREKHGGHAFAPPDDWFRRFEADFPYEETPDQEKAIEEVLADMARPICMDRLVCGDVGYGKTEVALRASFLAVLGGKQIAVLCPTTVLVEQHLRTFRERFDGYPVRVEALSRLTSSPRAKSVREDVASGRVDILIGTHKVLGKEVRFRELGLLVVDEEHRFGVAHKERMRELKTKVDVLTLSATPIPRTLHMSMGGLKELSVIATPPVDRKSVRTFVTPRTDEVVRKAVMTELERGGQIFFVHNRVRSLGETHEWLSELVPEARMVIAHGQMAASEVEEAMLRFVRGEANMLLSTSIIESGLDIPRANTIIIDSAQNFGLASLYQLRGRVGRSDRRAFAYLLIPNPRKLSDDARRRLEVINRFTDLGAGFHVASYDLEIRGGGDLLGPEQSGRIADVGFETYMEFLQEAVAELSGEELPQEVDPELDLHVEAFLPEGYVGDTGQRLVLYKRLSMARDFEGLEEIATEMADRYGPLPPEAAALVDVMTIRVLAKGIRAERVERADDRVVVSLGENPIIPAEAVATLLQLPETPWRVTRDLKVIFTFSRAESADPLPAAVRALKTLRACASEARPRHDGPEEIP